MKNKKQAMILGEVVFALFVCGILLGISINIFKSNDVTVTPKIYSILKNLPDINGVISEDCHDDGTCTAMNTLPDDRANYCERLADMLVTSGNVDCSTNNSEDVNFNLASGISFKGLVGNNGNRWTENNGRKYIDVQLGINGTDYPIRIFQYGEVIPGPAFVNDDEFFSYRAVLNHASNRRIGENNENADETDKFSRKTDVLSFVDNNRPLEKVSFRRAVCGTNPELIGRYYVAADNVNCQGIDQLEECEAESFEDWDNSAFCTVQPVKPRGSGIFKIFGI